VSGAAFEGWAILELMGHRRLGGFVREVELFGSKMCRIDVPDAKDPTKNHATQFYGGGAVYCLTPTTEETARRVATLAQPAPVQAWELPQLPARERSGHDSAAWSEAESERPADDDTVDDDNDEEADPLL